MTQRKQSTLWQMVTALAGFLALLSGIWLGADHNFLLSFLLILCALGLYLLQVFFVAERNWLDFRPVFSLVWLGTIGLAAMRLTEYQTVWVNKTWILNALAYLLLQFGVTVGLRLAPAISDKIVSCAKKLKVGRMYLKMHPNRLFWICIISTLISLTCFCINIAIKGFIPV